MLKKEWVYSFKRAAKVFIDAFVFAVSLTIAYKLRLDYNLSQHSQDWYWGVQLPFILSIVVFVRTAFMFMFQAYSRMWRYTEVSEILDLIKPVFLSSLLFATPRVLGFSAQNELFTIPIGVIVIDFALSLILLSFVRLVRKIQIDNREYEKRRSASSGKVKKRTLLVGAGIAGNELCRKVQHHPELNIEIICAVDDDDRKQKTNIANNVKVVGKISSIKDIASKYDIEQIIIAIPSLPPKQLREIINLCAETKIETNTIPGVDQLADGKVAIEQIRKVSLEDLLGREPVDLALPEIESFINDKVVLITGAGGSIGSELTKQLAKHFNPKKVYIMGRGENSIFHLGQELTHSANVNYSPVICDIRNYDLLYKHIKKISPDVIFHAAAHKHVPLMEDHPQEAFENNTIGTKNLAKIAGELKVKTFVNISTDKAVNPTNVLGCTKRLAELIVISCSKEYTDTKYVSVRFGNVIGSRGSVIPTWEYYLKNNLPITITSKDAYRFFMTTHEAAQLVIKSGAIGKTSEIMVLDMGDEVSIYKLAQDFIRFSGFDLDEINLKVTGLRPGEKLKEELVGYYEGANNTKYKKILVIESPHLPDEELKPTLEGLSSSVTNLDESTYRNNLFSETKRLNDLETKTLTKTTS